MARWYVFGQGIALGKGMQLRDALWGGLMDAYVNMPMHRPIRKDQQTPAVFVSAEYCYSNIYSSWQSHMQENFLPQHLRK